MLADSFGEHRPQLPALKAAHRHLAQRLGAEPVPAIAVQAQGVAAKQKTDHLPAAVGECGDLPQGAAGEILNRLGWGRFIDHHGAAENVLNSANTGSFERSPAASASQNVMPRTVQVKHAKSRRPPRTPSAERFTQCT